MANIRKKISELTALTSASLDTTIVGVDNGITYKIELDTLADAVALRVNILDRDRLDSLESNSGSYLTSLNGTISGSSQLTSSYDTRYVISGSITQTTWDNIANKPSGIVSQSTDLSSLNTFTASISTASLVNRLNAIENVSGSWVTENETGSFLTSLNGTISSSAQITSFGFVSQSTDITLLNSFTASQSILNTVFTNGINTRLQTSSFDTFSQSVDSRLIAATNEQSFNGLISGSSQLTTSFDTRYALSASFVSSSNLSSIQAITSASYAALTPVSGTLYIIIG